MCKFIIRVLIIIVIIATPDISLSQEKPYIPITTERLYIDILKNSYDYKRRAEAAYQLGRVESDIATDELLYSIINDDNVLVKEACAYSLGKIGTKEALDGLIDIIFDDHEESVTKRILNSISQIDGKNHIQIFLSFLESDLEEIRIETVKLLGRYKSDDVTEVLIKKLNLDDSINVNKYIILSLAKHEKNSLIPYITDVYNNSEQSEIISACATALYHLNEVLYNIKNPEFLGIVQNIFNTKRTLFTAYCLSFMGNRTSLKYLINEFNSPQLTSDRKGEILEALALLNFYDSFDIIIKSLNKKTFEFSSTISFIDTINAEKAILDAKIEILVRYAEIDRKYQNLIYNSLKFKIYNNPYNISKKFIPFLRQDNESTIEIINNTILSINHNIALQILQEYLTYDSVLLKINTLYILTNLDTDESFKVILDNIIDESSDFFVRAFRKLDNIPNYRLSKLFLDNLISQSRRLRIQALTSMINCTGNQMKKIKEMYLENLGKIDNNIRYRIEKLKETSIIPIYSLFTQDNKGIDRDIINNFIEYYNTLRNIDSEMLDESIPDAVYTLFWDYGIDFLNMYRVTLYYNNDFYKELYNILVTPILNYVMIEARFKDELKLMFIPIFSKIENDIFSNNSPRDLIIKEINNDNPIIVLTVAKNLVYLFRTLYKPVEEEKIDKFRQFLSRKVIQLTLLLIEFREINHSYLNTDDFYYYIPKKLITEIIHDIERAIAEAIIVDKVLYLSLLYRDLDPLIIRSLVHNVKVISKHNDVIETLIEISNNEIAYVRYEALLILSEYINNPKVYNVFIYKLGDEDESIRDLVINTLSNNPENITGEVVDFLHSDDQNIVNDTMDLLVRGGDSTLDIISNQFYETNNQNTRESIIEILGKINTKKSNQVLLSFLNDTSQDLQVKIIIILIGNLDEDVLNYDIGMISDNLILDSELEEYLKSEENSEDIKNSIYNVSKYLNTYDENIYNDTIKILSILGRYHIDFLINNLSSKIYIVRKGIEEAIIRIGKEIATKELIESLSNENSNIVSSCINILSFFGSSIIVELNSYLSSDNINIRYGITSVLYNIKEEETLYPLIVLLQDTNWRVVSLARRSLMNNFGFTSDELDILSNLGEEDLAEIENMTITEVRQRYL